jgi:hypothetical protein
VDTEVPLNNEQRCAVCAALAAIPPAFDQHELDANSADAIAAILHIDPEAIPQLLIELRESGAISPVLVPRGGADYASPARIRWDTHI